MSQIELQSSNLELEFNSANNAQIVMGKLPDKVNFVKQLGPLVTNNLAQAHSF